MAHCQKIKITDVGRVLDEQHRVSSYYKNNVDVTRADTNRRIFWDRQLGAVRMVDLWRSRETDYDSLRFKLDNKLKYRKQSNTIGLCDWVVTCPEAFKDDPNKQQEFFVTVYNYTVRRYGVDNVLGGSIHNDETTPHIHIPVIPVVDGDHLCAREFLTRKELKGYQEDLEEECASKFHLKGLILNGRTKGNYSLEELKERSEREQKLLEREQAITVKEQQVEQQLQALQQRGKQLEELIENVEESRKLAFRSRYRHIMDFTPGRVDVTKYRSNDGLGLGS